jgi:hypothetical protein
MIEYREIPTEKQTELMERFKKDAKEIGIEPQKFLFDADGYSVWVEADNSLILVQDKTWQE